MTRKTASHPSLARRRISSDFKAPLLKGLSYSPLWSKGGRATKCKAPLSKGAVAKATEGLFYLSFDTILPSTSRLPPPFDKGGKSSPGRGIAFNKAGSEGLLVPCQAFRQPHGCHLPLTREASSRYLRCNRYILQIRYV